MSFQPLPVKGLLCDLDGTLADSEPLHCQAWLDLLRTDYDLDFDEHWFEQFVGTSDRVVATHVIEVHGVDATTSELIDRKQRAFHAAVRTSAAAFDGVFEWLERIGKRFPLAIATNSGRADANLMIETLGLDRFTSVSVTASDVDHMKPAPDIYRLAAERLGLDPKDCIAIEDSGPGGVAARAAGCYLIGLTEAVADPDVYLPVHERALAHAFALLDRLPT